MAFSDVMQNTGGYGEKFKQTIEGIGEGLRGFIDGLAAVKEAMAPIVSAFMTIIGLVGKFASMLGPLKPLLALLAMGALTGRGKTMGPDGKPMNMGLGTGMLNFLSMGAVSRAQRGQMPEDMVARQFKEERREARRQRLREARTNLIKVPQAAALGARNAATAQMIVARATGKQVGDYFGTGAHGIPLSDTQINRKAGGPAFRAGMRAFGRGVVEETRKLGGPNMTAGLATLGMFAGGTLQGMTSKTSGLTQGLGGALAGAGLGASIGSMLPGPGTAIGAVVGAAAGGIGGIMSARSQAAQEKRAASERLREGSFAGIPVNDPFALRQRAAQLRSRGQTYNQGEFSALTKEMNAQMDFMLYGTAEGRTSKTTLSERGKVLADILDRGGDATSIATGASGFGDVTRGDMGEGFNRGSFADEDKLKRINQLLANQNELLPEEIKFLGEYRDQLSSSVNIKKSGLEDEKAYRGQLEQFANEMDKMADQQGQNFTLISDVMGVTGDAAAQLASSMKWDLGNGLLTIQDLIQGLGYTMVDLADETQVAARSADLMANRAKAAGRIMEDIMQPIVAAREQREANQQLNAAGQQLFNYTGSDPALLKQYSEDFTEASMSMFLQKYIKGGYGAGKEAYDKFVEDVQKSYYGTLVDASGLSTPGVVSAFGAESSRVIEQLQKGKTGFATRMQYDPAFALGIGSGTTKAAESYNKFRSEGLSSEEALTKATDQLKNEITVLTGGQIDVNTDEMAQTLQTLIQGQLNSTEQAFINALNKAKVQFEGKIDLNLKDNKGTILDTSSFKVTTSSGGGKALTATEVSNLQNAGITVGGGDFGDTSTSRLSRTLGKHMAFNKMISGNRTVTSALRNWNLGSGMSDHRFGNAYDLTGDNLGQYASLVNSSGGFAEFHGAAGGRHLHVVPPSGDSSSPAMTSGMGSTVTNNFNISVQGGPNASADEVARKVVTIIEDKQRSMRERS